MNQIAEVDYFVEATVIQVDEQRQNAILRVARYLKGTGGAYLAFIQFTSSFYAVDNRGYDKGCLYGSSYPYLRLGEHGFYGLTSNGDGTYHSIYYGSVILRHLIENNTVTYPHFDGSSYVDITVSLEEFEHEIAPYLNQHFEFIPSNYLDASDYPLMQQLNIYTESGRHYLMEVNRHVREIDLNEEPFATSPDGAHVAYYVDNRNIAFRYCYYPTCQQGNLPHELVVTGQAAEFSPNSNYVIVWNDERFTLYGISNEIQAFYGREMRLTNFGEVQFSNAANVEDRLISWGGNSNTIVYLDATGVWYWQLYRMRSPQLIVTASELSSHIIGEMEFLELSETGSYLRLGNGMNWKLLDINNHQYYDNALITPDESNFIYVNSTVHDSPLIRENCSPPFYQSCPIAITHEGELIGTEWWINGRVSLYFCDANVSSCYSTTVTWEWGNPTPNYGSWEWGWMGSIDSLQFEDMQITVIQRDDYEIELYYDALDAEEFYRHETYNLSQQLDSPIIRLELGKPIFYEAD